MTAAHFCSGYRISTLGVDCGKSPPSVSRTYSTSSQGLTSRSRFSECSSEPSHTTVSQAQHVARIRTQLQNLPNELIDYILGFLDGQGPSFLNYAARPSLNLTRSISRPLKCISLTCQVLRSLTVPRLFSYACLKPSALTAFLQFVRKNDLSCRIFSVVAILDNSDNYLTHPLWWALLLKTLRNVIWFSILAPPLGLGSLLDIPVPDAESWAFNMPYHLFRLRRPLPLSFLDNKATLNAPESSLFTWSNWDQLSLNEGSCLKAYSIYEYFLRKTPSMLASVKPDPEPSDLTNCAAGMLFNRLQSFTYIAIFPFYNHVDNILKHVRQMTKLKVLVTQLSTRADVDAISDEHVDETKKVDMNDCWMELGTSYDLILHTVLYLAQQGQLQKWEAKDVSSNSGIKDELVSRTQGRLRDGWTMEAEGVWSRIHERSHPMIGDSIEIINP